MMSPRRIVAEAVNRGIDLIAVTDHNSAGNVSAVAAAARGTAMTVLPGMEVCTKEEVHILAIFDNVKGALTLQSLVFSRLSGKNEPDAFGLQVIANEMDEVEGFEDHLLSGAADIGIEETIAVVHRLDGIAIAAHIDRESFSVIGQLGFIPEKAKFDALEVMGTGGGAGREERFGDLSGYAFVRNSDAHFLNHIGSQTTRFWMEQPTLLEMKKSLRGEEGRRVEQGSWA